MLTIGYHHTHQAVELLGNNLAKGDWAKWVSADAPSCDSSYDTTRAAEIRGDDFKADGSGVYFGDFYFGIVGAHQLCYKFKFGGRIAPTPYTLFPNIRASVIGFTGRAPRATALNCSTQLLIRGEGFLTLAAMVPGGASNIHCNFSNVEGGVLPPSELHALPSPDVANTTVLYNYSTSGVAIVNDTHLYCATPRSIRTGALPVRLDVGEHGYYTASLPGALLQDEFHVYDPQDR